MTATVDTAGNLAVTRRATLTRMAAGGLLLGPLGALGSLGFKKRKDIDTRELYLVLDSPALASVVKCPADQGNRAREFATRVNNQAKIAGQLAAQRPAQIQAARNELQAAIDATDRVHAAEAESEAVRNDPSMCQAIADAQGQLELAQAALEQPSRGQPASQPPSSAAP